MKSTLKACIVLQNMVLEVRSDGYKSESRKLGEYAAKEGIFIGENGENTNGDHEVEGRIMQVNQ